VHPRRMSRPRSAARAFLVCALSLAIAVVTGVEWLGRPLRLVELLTLLALGASAGIALSQALAARRSGSTSATRGAAAGSVPPEND
jgi:hypothetical protein